MKHFLLKFNHGVEIGARLAYLGHYERTKLNKVMSIATDELQHRITLLAILRNFGDDRSKTIDFVFTLIGNVIKFSCKFCPMWSLNLVARSMELFAVFNYKKLAVTYPQFKDKFTKMAHSEMDHERYFRLGPVLYHKFTSPTIDNTSLPGKYK